jgi:hypothetical protein
MNFVWLPYGEIVIWAFFPYTDLYIAITLFLGYVDVMMSPGPRGAINTPRQATILELQHTPSVAEPDPVTGVRGSVTKLPPGARSGAVNTNDGSGFGSEAYYFIKDLKRYPNSFNFQFFNLISWIRSRNRNSDLRLRNTAFSVHLIHFLNDCGPGS